jgi:hypothetical protein
MIGVGEDEVHAILDVEAAGTGFDKQGRPKMLFEPHVFYRNLSGPQRDAAVKAGLAYPKWKRNYPADSYPRLLKAMKINETAALKAASWGLGQILGENHRKAGYATPQAMVADFIEDEDNHLEAMIRFIKSANLAKHLKSHNWAGFARGYNGPGFAANGYDKKLAASYAKWKRIKDTPYNGGEEPKPVPAPKPKPVPKPEPDDISNPPLPEPEPEVTPKGNWLTRFFEWLRSLFSFKRRPDRTVKGAVTAIGAAGATQGTGLFEWIGNQATDLKEAVEPLMSAAPLFETLFVVLAVVGLIYMVWAPKKKEAE